MWPFGNKKEEKIKDLTRKMKDKLDKLAEIGNSYFDNQEYEKALEIYQSALDIIPPPQNVHSETAWFQAVIGDVYFYQEDFYKAKKYFDFALKNISGFGSTNPFVLLRFGQCCLKTGDEKSALEYLLRAYMLKGKDLFQEDSPEYFDFLKANVELDDKE